MIKKLWLYPPMAFARLGSSDTPCDNFHWGANDMRPRGTGKTIIEPAQTLHVSTDGTVSASIPSQITFKDAQGFKPVCPFFELHGEWSTPTGDKTGSITPEVLAEFGLTTSDLQWKIEVANLKPYHYTLELGDRLKAVVEITGDTTQRQLLQAVSPPEAQQPLASVNQPVPLGSIQLTRPTDEFREIRLRFTPAKGKVYAPTNLKERLRNSSSWQNLEIPLQNQILNPEAAWCKFVIADDPRTNPGGLYAAEDDTRISLGLVDDVCDGVISCSLPGVAIARARIVVGPPDYAPDRRPLTSLADGLSDRVGRDDVLEAGYVDDLELTGAEVRDLLERVLETMEAMNLDIQNDRARGENRAIAVFDQSLPPEAAANKAFPEMESILGRPLPLTEFGRGRHRRFISVEVFEDMLRERPELIDKWIREPMTEEKYYDRKMPALMRGSDRYPMHITRRQYQLLIAWANRLRQDAELGT